MHYLGDPDHFICPRCLYEFEENSLEPESTGIYCPQCEQDITVVFMTDYWHEMAK